MKTVLLLAAALLLALPAGAAEKAAPAKAAKKAKAPQSFPCHEVTYPCSFDNSQQKALVYFVPEKTPRPLVVALHTWSCTYANTAGYAALAALCRAKDSGEEVCTELLMGEFITRNSTAKI